MRESIGDFLAIVKVNKREYWRLLGHCQGKQGKVLKTSWPFSSKTRESVGDFLAIFKVNEGEDWRLFGHCQGKQGRVLETSWSFKR